MICTWGITGLTLWSKPDGVSSYRSSVRVRESPWPNTSDWQVLSSSLRPVRAGPTGPHAAPALPRRAGPRPAAIPAAWTGCHCCEFPS